MLNKELLMGNTGGQQPVVLTVGMKNQGTSIRPVYEYGYEKYKFGELAPEPFWGLSMRLGAFKYRDGSSTICKEELDKIIATAYVSGYPDSPIEVGETIRGDIFELKEKVGQDVYLTFDPPPTGTWIQRHSNRSRNRVLCRRSSLGGAKC